MLHGVTIRNKLKFLLLSLAIYCYWVFAKISEKLWETVVNFIKISFQKKLLSVFDWKKSNWKLKLFLALSINIEHFKLFVVGQAKKKDNVWYEFQSDTTQERRHMRRTLTLYTVYRHHKLITSCAVPKLTIFAFCNKNILLIPSNLCSISIKKAIIFFWINWKPL